MPKDFRVVKISEDFYAISSWEGGEVMELYTNTYKKSIKRAKSLGIDFHKELNKTFKEVPLPRVPTSTLPKTKPNPKAELPNKRYRIRKSLQSYLRS